MPEESEPSSNDTDENKQNISEEKKEKMQKKAADINLISDDFENEGPDQEDYDHFIKEMQRILEESPPGMQAQFARTISQLKERKTLMKETASLNGSTQPANKQQFDELMKVVEKHEFEKGVSLSMKFKNLLKLALLREELSEAKKTN
jgi:hypothetical protein